MYECDTNSIKHNEPWIIDTRTTYVDDLLYLNLNGKNDYYGSTKNSNFLQVITENTQPYCVMEREFAIVAGKFTGRISVGTVCDDLVVLYPERQGNVDERTNENLLLGKVKLLSNIQKDTIVDATELITISDRSRLMGLSVADYASESAELGDVKKVVSDIKERNYLALLHALPFHVDNLAADGSALEAQPRNFTYRNGSEVAYQDSAQTTSKDVASFQMSNSVETVFAFDSPELRNAVGTYNKIKGLTAFALGNSTVQTLPGAPAIAKTFDGITGIINKLTDRMTTTTNTTNSNASTVAIDLTATAATKSDVVYFSKSNQYIWRYPVLTKPTPAWLTGERIDRRGNFASADVDNQQSFITFPICDTPYSTTAYALDDSLYQPFHEPGNLFSYPAALEQIEGYADRTKLTGALEWNGPRVEKTLFLTQEAGEHTVKSTKLETGLFSKALSFIDSVFKTDLANVPEAGNPTDFTRTTNNAESITVKILELNGGAGYKLMMDGYLDISGAMAMSFAVTGFNRDDALWGTNSLYSKKPDPSLVLPYKFPFSQHPDTKGELTQGFTGNDNDPTALKIKGLRFFAPDYGLGSSELLLMGLKYQINVPIYNASFIDAKGITVRLSYEQTNEYNATRRKIQYLSLDLPGWGGGNRVLANFE